MKIQQLQAPVRNDFAAVNNLIIHRIQEQSGIIDDLSNHIIQSGGKRLRPLLVLLASHACNYSGQNHIKLAAMIEFLHTASLLHDDVIDESALRRGRETAHKIWGSKASILVGDYLFTQYMQLMIDVGDMNIIQILTNIVHRITCSELKQLSNKHDPYITVNDYMEVIQSKTSSLFSVSARLGALISGANQETEHALTAYGLHLGNIFQLIDDALDYCSDAQTMGKNAGDDLADGKVTMPLLHALKHGTPAQQETIVDSIKHGRREKLPEILAVINSTKAIEYTKSVAATEAALAKQALCILPESIYKAALLGVVDYALQRDH